MNHTEALSILSELNVEVVPANVAPRPGATRAVATVQRIVNRHGFDHARMTMLTLRDTENKGRSLTETAIWATSDIILAFKRNYPDIMENHVDRFFDFYDRIPLGALEALYCRGLDGIANKRAALVGQVWERAVRVFGTQQLDLLDDRRGAA